MHKHLLFLLSNSATMNNETLPFFFLTFWKQSGKRLSVLYLHVYTDPSLYAGEK